MLSLKIFLFLSSISLTFSTQHRNKNFEPYVRFKAFQCTSSNITITDFKCFIKAHSRRNTTMNIFVNIKKPIYDVKARYDYRAKYLSNSQRAIINVTLEVCSILNGTGSNPVFNWIMGMMPELKSLVHRCPYRVSL